MTYTDLLFVFGLLPAYIIIVFVCRENWEKNVASLAFSLVFILWARPAYYALVVIDLFVDIREWGRFKQCRPVQGGEGCRSRIYGAHPCFRCS